MDSPIFNKQNLVIFLVIVLFIVVLCWVIMPAHKSMPMEMGMEMGMENFGTEQENKMEDKTKPFVDAQTGSLIDGPGFENGQVDGITQEMMSKIPSNMYFLDDGGSPGGEYSIENNLCSRSCCSAQWPTPFKQKYDPYVCSNGNGSNADYVAGGSNIFCNNSFQDAGCLCLTKKQQQFLYNRGGNGRELF
jgi:hypothetical protein